MSPFKPPLDLKYVVDNEIKYVFVYAVCAITAVERFYLTQRVALP